MSEDFFEDKKIISVRYTSEAHDNIIVKWTDDGETTRNDVYGFDNLNHPVTKSVIDSGWNAERIQKETVKYNQRQNDAYKEIIRFMAKQEIEDLEAKYLAKIDKLEKSVGMGDADLVNAVITNTDDDVLFKAKLSAFELEKVQKSKAKTLKADIRGAESLIKLFGILAKLYK